jgi:uncharacterized membrane-anchored protein YjiN (DUF445 family)
MSARPQRSLATMRLLATGLLAFMVLIFFIARASESQALWIGYVRAFAEAATVGALADWFAVTALFRHPLGLPIPHTAIIPRSKDRIGEGLGNFLESNFLRPDIIGEKLDRFDLLGEAATWVRGPDRARLLAESAADMLPRALDWIGDGPVESALHAFVGARLKETDLATLAADGIEFVTTQQRHRGLLDHLIRAADALINESERDIRARVRANTGFFARLFSLDKTAADAIVDGVRGALREMATDPQSLLRARFDEALRKLAGDLRSSQELRAEVEAFKTRVLEHPEIQQFVNALWRAVKRDLQAGATSDKMKLARPLESAVLRFADRISADDPLRQALNERLRLWIFRLASERGGDVSRFVAETIKGWDARTVIARIESGVGADLQYIRISGTIIGGLVGLILHLLEQTLF